MSTARTSSRLGEEEVVGGEGGGTCVGGRVGWRGGMCADIEEHVSDVWIRCEHEMGWGWALNDVGVSIGVRVYQWLCCH